MGADGWTQTLDSRRALFVVSGTQGAGKTTVSRLIAQRFERGAHVSGDVLQKMILSGERWPEASEMEVNNAVTGEAAAQLRLRLRHACVLARSFVAAGFTAVIDDIVVGERLEELVAELDGQPFIFVMLTPNLDAVRERELGRGTRLFEQWEWLNDAVLSTRQVGLWIDSSDQTADQTVDEIMRRAWTEGIVSSAVTGAAS